MTSAPPITGVSEIVLSVADLPVMREYYTQILGFEFHSELSMEQAEPDPQGEPTITFLKISDVDTPLGNGGHPQMLVLIDYRRHVHAKNRLTGHDVQRSTLNHLAFEISPDSFSGFENHLHANGIELAHASFPALNARAMFFVDPEGNRLELISHFVESV